MVCSFLICLLEKKKKDKSAFQVFFFDLFFSLFLYSSKMLAIQSQRFLNNLFYSTDNCNEPSSLNPDDEGCKLLDSFAILVQITLATTAILTLFYKRSRERPQRPVIVW